MATKTHWQKLKFGWSIKHFTLQKPRSKWPKKEAVAKTVTEQDTDKENSLGKEEPPESTNSPTLLQNLTGNHSDKK